MTGEQVPVAPSAHHAAADGARPPRGRRVPMWVWAAAVVAALIHMAPYGRAELETPDGWHFSGNLSISPDYMQYRVWMRQTALEGPLVTNAFTAEPNRAYLPVTIYWIIGAGSRAIGITPEWGYAWLGAIAAVAFVVILWAGIRRFVANTVAAAWAFGIIMLGGGLGGYVVLLDDSPRAQQNAVIHELILRPFAPGGGVEVFDRFRGNYPIQALFDTHFLIFWVVTIGAVLSLHGTVRTFTARRLMLTASVFALGTLLHVYEGITLLVIAMCVLGLAMMRGLMTARQAATTFAACVAGIAVILLPLLYLASQSGLPAPTWRGLNTLFLVVVMGYPLAFIMLFHGFARFWRDADLDAVFLVGWATGGLLLLLSAPVFPYSDRGTMTLAIPLAIISVLIWFSTRSRVSLLQGIVLVLLLGSTPVSVVRSLERRTTFKEVESHKWTNTEHERVVTVLRERAARGDVLVADEASLRWIAPEYPGVHYAGHFFLTTAYATRVAELQQFMKGATAAERTAFLARARPRWIFATPSSDTSGIASLPGVTIAARTGVGTLFEVDGGSSR